MAGEELYVSVSGGQTVLDMVSALPERKSQNVNFYAAALIGRGRSTRTAHVGPETTATIAWARTGRLPGHLYYGTVPPYVIETNIPEAYRSKSKHEQARYSIVRQVEELSGPDVFANVLEDMTDNINIAVAGIGLVSATGPDVENQSGHLEKLTMLGLVTRLGISPGDLEEEGAVGDFSYCRFDKNRKGNRNWNFFMTAGANSDHPGVEFYRNLVSKGRKVIAIAG